MDLRQVMQWDVRATGVSTLLTIAAAPLWGDWLGVSAWVPLGVGLALVPWVALLTYTARQEPLRRWQVATIAAGNLGWVLAATVIIFAFPGALSSGGRWIVGGFSLVVLAFGVAQVIGLRRAPAQVAPV